MSISSIAMYAGINDILEAFCAKAKTPYFSLWIGNEKFDENTVNDMDAAIEQLREDVERFIKRNMTNNFRIILHDTKKTTYTKEKEAKVLLCNAFETKFTNVNDGGNNYFQAQLLEKINAIESKVNALESEEVEEEGEISGTEGTLKQINEFIGSPAGAMLLGLFAPKLAQNNLQPITSLAGTENELELILNTLFSKGVKVEHLAKLAQMSEDKIQMLISML